MGILEFILAYPVLRGLRQVANSSTSTLSTTIRECNLSGESVRTVVLKFLGLV